jgi:hypothetical protein
MSEIMKAIAAAMTDDWQTSKQIADKIDCWAPASIRTSLKEYAENGDCEREVRGSHGLNKQAFYRRHQHADPA